MAPAMPRLGERPTAARLVGAAMSATARVSLLQPAELLAIRDSDGQAARAANTGSYRHRR